MKKRLLVFMFSTLLLSSCGIKVENSFLPKETGNENFEEPGNMEKADLKIDGILDEPEWDHPCLTVNMGGTDKVKASSEVKILFGDNGLTVGFYTLDVFIASSTDYNNPEFVVNSDNVEFYIDTKNDKGVIAKNDDYTFLVNPEEYSEMRVGTGSYWGPWSGVIDYGVSVQGTINDDSDIDTGWGCEIFLPYKTFGFTKDSVVGIALGMRDKTTNLKTSEWCGWTPDPQVISTYVSINKDGYIRNDCGDVSVNAGKFSYDEANDEYISESPNSLATFKSLEMREGTYSVDMFIPKMDNDNGIIFQVKPNESGLFWEGVGVRYYTLLINKDGLGLLGKTNNGQWATLSVSPCSYKVNDYNNVKVVVDGNTIYGFINGVLVTQYSEALYSTIKVGIRAGSVGVKYKNIKVSASKDIDPQEESKIDGYTDTWGTFDYADKANNLVKATSLTGSGAILMKDNSNLSSGTIKASVKTGANCDSGIIFRVNNAGASKFWEAPASYYFFFINLNGDAYLGCVNNGWINVGGVTKHIDGFDVNTTYNLKVTFSATHIDCYVNDKLMLSADDNSCTGSGYGVRVGSTQSVISLPTEGE